MGERRRMWVVWWDDSPGEEWDVCMDKAGRDATMYFATREEAERWARANGVLMNPEPVVVGETHHDRVRRLVYEAAQRRGILARR